ncbi:MAG: hypothetical protein BGO34_01625 [Bacteroidia bacterium 44-10]|nr:MAG: hypothetical protein BGO34_01625 [Bacteroidia bacterium 44-10]
MGKLIISQKLENALFTMNELIGIIADESVRIQDVSLKEQYGIASDFTEHIVEAMSLVSGLIVDDILSQVK